MRSVVPKRVVQIPDNAERVFEGIIYDVYHWQQELYDGTSKTFEMLRRPDTVQVIAVKDDKVVLIKQEQPNVGLFYDVPGGRNDIAEEDELQCAQRELLEETGMVFKTWRLLDVVQPMTKVDWLVYTFLATDFESQAGQQLDAGEKVTVKVLDFAEAKQLILSDKGRFKLDAFKDANSIDDILRLPSYGS